MVKLTIRSFFLPMMIAVLISACYNSKKKVELKIQIVQTSQKSVKIVFKIFNYSNKNLIIFIPKLLLSKENCTQYFSLTEPGIFKSTKLIDSCDFIDVPFSAREPLFVIDSTNYENNKYLLFSLLHEGVPLFPEFDFSNIQFGKFPELFFIKSNTTVFYEYSSNSIWPIGEYKISVNYDMWKTRPKGKLMFNKMRGISEVEEYEFYNRMDLGTSKSFVIGNK